MLQVHYKLVCCVCIFAEKEQTRISCGNASEIEEEKEGQWVLHAHF
jgi:hypothetical protein